jgi:death-on-curing protein
MAAAYAFHIAENQPFIDGNKRAALNAALVFLDVNGWVVDDPGMRLYDAMIGLSSRGLDKHGLAKILRELASPIRTRRQPLSPRLLRGVPPRFARFGSRTRTS